MYVGNPKTPSTYPPTSKLPKWPVTISVGRSSSKARTNAASFFRPTNSRQLVSWIFRGVWATSSTSRNRCSHICRANRDRSAGRHLRKGVGQIVVDHRRCGHEARRKTARPACGPAAGPSPPASPARCRSGCEPPHTPESRPSAAFEILAVDDFAGSCCIGDQKRCIVGLRIVAKWAVLGKSDSARLWHRRHLKIIPIIRQSPPQIIELISIPISPPTPARTFACDKASRGSSRAGKTGRPKSTAPR